MNGVLASLPDKLIRVLPPAMVLLITLNVIFLGTLLYLVESNAEYRNQILTKIVENCLVRDNRQ